MPHLTPSQMGVSHLQSGMRRDSFDRFGDAVRVIRTRGGDMEAEVFAWLQTCPRILPMLRCRFMGHQAPVLLILHHHHPVVRAHRGGAVN